jgi:hypothetical protein
MEDHGLYEGKYVVKLGLNIEERTLYSICERRRLA